VVGGWLKTFRKPPGANHQPSTTMLKWIVFAPLIGAIINGLFGRRFLALLGQKATERLVGFIACASVGVSAALAFTTFFGRLLPLPEGQRIITEHLFTWLKVGSFQADFAYLLDPLSSRAFTSCSSLASDC